MTSIPTPDPIEPPEVTRVSKDELNQIAHVDEFNIDAVLQGAQAEKARLEAAIEADQEKLTSTRARIARNKASIDKINRLLNAQKPRTRKGSKAAG